MAASAPERASGLQCVSVGTGFVKGRVCMDGGNGRVRWTVAAFNIYFFISSSTPSPVAVRVSKQTGDVVSLVVLRTLS